MSFIEEDYLPSPQELEVEEIRVSWMPLKTAARSIATYCDEQNKEYLLCKEETQDPRKCIEEGKDVTRCGNKFLRLVKKHCNTEFTHYWRCIDRSVDMPAFKFCKREQERYYKCLETEMGVEIPPLGYFSKPRLHTAKREYKALDPLGDMHGVKPMVRPDPKRIAELQEQDVTTRIGAQYPSNAP